MNDRAMKMVIDWIIEKDKQGLYYKGKCSFDKSSFGVFSITKGIDEKGKPDEDKIYHRLIFNPWRTNEDQFCVVKVEYGKAIGAEQRLKDVAYGWACAKLNVFDWDFAYNIPKKQTQKKKQTSKKEKK